MSGGSVELPAGASATVFEVDRFAWTSDDRLEVSGRWYGVRGMRFVRPTLDLEGADGRRRLLAVLDHKPWAPDEGQSWVAAFPWDGDPLDFASAELAVTPTIAVRLDPPSLPGTKRKAKAKPEPEPPADGAEPSEVEQERDAALEARDAALRRVERVQKASEEAIEERVAPVREHFERERDAARDALRERDEARAERDEARRMAREALERAHALTRERDEARAVAQAQRDARAELARELEEAPAAADPEVESELVRERDEARDAARAQRDARTALARRLEEAQAALARAEGSQAKLVRERDDARRERDAAVQARDRAPVHHDTLVSDLASALRERDAARHQLNEALAALQAAEGARDAALARPPEPASAAPVVHRRQERPAASWGPRLLALTALAVLIVVLWTLLNGVV